MGLLSDGATFVHNMLATDGGESVTFRRRGSTLSLTAIVSRMNPETAAALLGAVVRFELVIFRVKRADFVLDETAIVPQTGDTFIWNGDTYSVHSVEGVGPYSHTPGEVQMKIFTRKTG